jgi:ribosome-associated toxin RatA of RatAB toxin-antitoxin module
MMPQKIHKSALVPYSAEQMYNLVNDVDGYHRFLPWCSASTQVFHSESEAIATITIGHGGLKKAFTTRNALKHAKSIDICLVKGPFKRLHGHWDFHVLSNGCKVTLDMDFEIANPLLRITLEPVFSKIVNTLIDSFIKQAGERYGKL